MGRYSRLVSGERDGDGENQKPIGLGTAFPGFSSLDGEEVAKLERVRFRGWGVWPGHDVRNQDRVVIPATLTEAAESASIRALHDIVTAGPRAFLHDAGQDRSLSCLELTSAHRAREITEYTEDYQPMHVLLSSADH